MPVFTEYAASSRELRVLPSFAPPLPRLSSSFEPNQELEDKYEVVIVGVSVLLYDSQLTPSLNLAFK
jgi:phenol 2-monooxygenase (NADPH)